jgi:hypothetical protein
MAPSGSAQHPDTIPNCQPQLGFLSHNQHKDSLQSPAVSRTPNRPRAPQLLGCQQSEADQIDDIITIIPMTSRSNTPSPHTAWGQHVQTCCS